MQFTPRNICRLQLDGRLVSDGRLGPKLPREALDRRSRASLLGLGVSSPVLVLEEQVSKSESEEATPHNTGNNAPNRGGRGWRSSAAGPFWTGGGSRRFVVCRRVLRIRRRPWRCSRSKQLSNGVTRPLDRREPPLGVPLLHNLRGLVRPSFGIVPGAPGQGRQVKHAQTVLPRIGVEKDLGKGEVHVDAADREHLPVSGEDAGVLGALG